MKAKYMFTIVILAIGGTLTLLVGRPSATNALSAPLSAQAQPGEPVLHTESDFEFTVHAPYKTVVPLFGAFRERCWGGDDWNPEFLYPAPPADKFGEVFTLKRGQTLSTWVNTALDLESGHIQYVYFVPDALTVLIDIHVRRTGADDTGVKVLYQHTALNPELNSQIAELGRNHREMGPHWASAISACLPNQRANRAQRPRAKLGGVC